MAQMNVVIANKPERLLEPMSLRTLVGWKEFDLDDRIFVGVAQVADGAVGLWR